MGLYLNSLTQPINHIIVVAHVLIKNAALFDAAVIAIKVSNIF